MIAPSSIVTWPARVAAFAMMTRLPTTQSWAMWQYAITRVLFPTRVTPPPPDVPRFTVANSRTMFPSPISTHDSSPRNFRSCGIAPTEANEWMRFPFPIRTWDSMTACDPTVVPSPIVTFGPITANGPTVTSFPSSAPGSMMAVGWIMSPPPPRPARRRPGSSPSRPPSPRARRRPGPPRASSTPAPCGRSR